MLLQPHAATAHSLLGEWQLLFLKQLRHPVLNEEMEWKLRAWPLLSYLKMRVKQPLECWKAFVKDTLKDLPTGKIKRYMFMQQVQESVNRKEDS